MKDRQRKENGELADVTHRFMTRNSMSYATELIPTTPMDELQHRDVYAFLPIHHIFKV